MRQRSSDEQIEGNADNRKQVYDKCLHNIFYESIKQKQHCSRRAHVLPFDDPASNSSKGMRQFINKDILLSQAIKKQKTTPNANTTDLKIKKQVKQKYFESLEDQHLQISKENMLLLGLNIRKISYVQKSKRNSRSEVGFEIGCMEAGSEQVDKLEEEVFILKNAMLSKTYSNSHMKSASRKGSIAVRQKSANSGNGMRKIIKTFNAQYQNPIYDARISSYREFIFKLNYTYGVYINTQKYDDNNGLGNLRSDQKYNAWIGTGNNGALVKELFARRFWWQTVDEKQNVNFLWTQLKQNDFFKKQQPAHFVSDQTFESVSLEELSIIKLRKKKLQGTDEDYLYKVMNKQDQAQFKVVGKYFKNKQYIQKKEICHLKQLNTQSQKMHNHLTNNFYLGNKKALFYNLKEYYQLTGEDLFKVIPLTFHIKRGLADPQYKRFVNYHKKRQQYIKQQEKQQEKGGKIKRAMRNIWIVKPGELTNRGKGITVIDEIYEVQRIIKNERYHENGSQKSFIVQLYIDRPFLYKKRKFDIRHYMLITQLHGIFKAYWYKQGYIRTTSYEFDVHSFDPEIHLTNDAVQKYTPLYGKYEPANKLSYVDFQKYLDSNYSKEKYNLEQQILPKMKKIALDSIKSSFVRLSPERLKHNFQIFGLDFMIDSQFNPWLIEINTNPCLQLACPLLSRIIPQMVDHAFRLTVDLVYPPPCHYPNTCKHYVPDASLQRLKFELIFDEKVDGKEIRQLYKQSKNNLLVQIGPIQDDEVYQNKESNIVLDELIL